MELTSMGKKGGSKHLKREPAPNFWPIPRKRYAWVVKPKAGSHAIQKSLPLTIVLRDILGFGKTKKEAGTILSQGKVLVDGKIRREEAFPIGLMDVLAIPEAKADYRVLSHRKGLVLHPIKKDEAQFKLCRIENKTHVKKGNIQLNLHDGTNKLIQVADLKNPAEDIYETLDVVKVAIPSGEIVGQIKLTKGNSALITGGKNRGMHGKILDIEQKPGERLQLLATIEGKSGKNFQTILDYVFPVGDSEQAISLPEEA
jgi:small subunit ribosomal protein S4e